MSSLTIQQTRAQPTLKMLLAPIQPSQAWSSSRNSAMEKMAYGVPRMIYMLMTSRSRMVSRAAWCEARLVSKCVFLVSEVKAPDESGALPYQHIR